MASVPRPRALTPVAVHGRCMIAHSFEGECFGPAQALHGCTYVVDAIVEGPKLQTGANYLVDFCPAERLACRSRVLP